MGEVSESPLGNKSIRYLNSHYADVASQNKESIAKWVGVEGKGANPRREAQEGLIRENWANAPSWKTRDSYRLEFSFNKFSFNSYYSSPSFITRVKVDSCVSSFHFRLRLGVIFPGNSSELLTLFKQRR